MPASRILSAVLAAAAVVACAAPTEPSVEASAQGAPLARQPHQAAPDDQALSAARARFERVEQGEMTLLHRRGDLWLGSQPALTDLQELAAAGLRTVVSLRPGDEPIGYDEERAVEQLGLRWVGVAYDEPHNLDRSVFARTRQVLSDPKARPLLLHCATGNRVGPVWIAWRVLDEGAEFADALAEARILGLRFLPYADKARAYIERELSP